MAQVPPQGYEGYPTNQQPQPAAPAYGFAPPPAGGPPQMQMQPHAMPQQTGGWMPRPEVPNCPPGLEYLTQIDQLLVHQAVELFEALTDIETKNKYKVKNSAGQQIFFAGEESGFCTRQCCGSRRGFTMHIIDNFGQEVMRMEREFKCFAGCCWCAAVDCCAFDIRVEAPVGTPIGYVRQSCSAWRPKFEIQNADHECLLTMTGPWCICQCPCCDVDFDVFDSNGDEIGKVTKQWSGMVKEIFTDTDNFGINFPMDLDVKVKATLLAAVFLINMMYFEDKNGGSDG